MSHRTTQKALKQKIDVKNPVMGNWKYEIISLRLF